MLTDCATTDATFWMTALQARLIRSELGREGLQALDLARPVQVWEFNLSGKQLFANDSANWGSKVMEVLTLILQLDRFEWAATGVAA